MKRYISIFAALIVMLALCSCGADSSKPTESTTTSSETTTTTLIEQETTTTSSQTKATKVTTKQTKTTTSAKQKQTTATLREEETTTDALNEEEKTTVITEISTTQESVETESTTLADSGDSNEEETAVKSLWDGSSVMKWSKGSGTAGDPYLIESAANLAYLAQSTTYEDMYFLLTTDIDLGYCEWTPIGTKTNPFCGNFDGNGHTISRVFLSKAHFNMQGEIGYERRGLFGHTKNCTITNLCVDGVQALVGTRFAYTDRYFIGGLIGYAETDCESLIENCRAENVLIEFNTTDSPRMYVGGLVGYAYSTTNATLKFSRVAVNAEMRISTDGENRFGGVIGGVELDGVASFSNVCSYVENSQGTASSSKGRYRVSPLIGILTTDNGSLNLSTCFLSLRTNEQRYCISSDTGYDSYAYACAGAVNGEFKGKSKFANVFFTASIKAWAGGPDEEFLFLPRRLTEYKNVTVSNCKFVYTLPENCGFNESIWDLTERRKPKLK